MICARCQKAAAEPMTYVEQQALAPALCKQCKAAVAWEERARGKSAWKLVGAVSRKIRARLRGYRALVDDREWELYR